ncbi:MAG: UDP-glycosyltransferase [Bacteroidota bacterium]
MRHNKILILIPDGVGLRNFVFSKIPDFLKKSSISFTYWNATPFDFDKVGFKSIPLKAQPHPKSDLLKRARKIIEINNSIKKTKNLNYKSYIFKPANKRFKQKVKNIIEKFYVFKYRNNLKTLRNKIKKTESGTTYFQKCIEQLKKQQPHLLLVSNQRPINAVAPVEAAKMLGIPTISFVFSWDNLPKATMVVETDHYLVWSDLMKMQLLDYYSYIDANQVFVVGTPQFEIHSISNFIESRDAFCAKYSLDKNKEYICVSGDDITTSPHDQNYLNDIATAVRYINDNKLYSKTIGIIFRPCPVDYSDRFDEVLTAYADEITTIRPAWKKHADAWNTIMPTLEDQILLANTVKHTSLVINVGSSMAFDYAAQNKACCYINYNPNVKELKKDIYKIYNYIHFQSMPNKDAVIWLNSKEEIADKILEGLNNQQKYVANAQKWFEVINQQPADQASERIVKAINQIISNKL